MDEHTTCDRIMDELSDRGCFKGIDDDLVEEIREEILFILEDS